MAVRQGRRQAGAGATRMKISVLLKHDNRQENKKSIKAMTRGMTTRYASENMARTSSTGALSEFTAATLLLRSACSMRWAVASRRAQNMRVRAGFPVAEKALSVRRPCSFARIVHRGTTSSGTKATEFATESVVRPDAGNLRWRLAAVLQQADTWVSRLTYISLHTAVRAAACRSTPTLEGVMLPIAER
jgi:hypothetical protein